LSVYLGCIADDFTGATDLAGLLARSGVKVSLRIGVPKEDPIKSETSDFEVIALKCRSVSVKKAIKETRSALSWLTTAGAKKIFWKYCSTFDSTNKGNIGPVAEAFMEDLETEQTIYCPAFPENGRSVFMGNLFVGETLLSESSMKDHPLNPMNDSNLMRVLDSQTKGKVGLANRLIVAKGVKALQNHTTNLKDKNIKHVIIDAVANEDLDTIAQSFYDWPLITGGSAIARPLSDIYKNLGLVTSPKEYFLPNNIERGSIVLSGSCSQMTRKQVSKYLKQSNGFKLDPIEISEKGLNKARQWLKVQEPDIPKIMYSSLEPSDIEAAQERYGVSQAGKIIEKSMAILALDAFSLGIRRYVIAGGETSGAIINALKVNKLILGPEICSGVPWTFVKKENDSIAVCLKSGNFGEANFFSEAFNKLDNI
jgi:uncharacterized protein YgbK (DUF1537 family)